MKFNCDSAAGDIIVEILSDACLLGSILINIYWSIHVYFAGIPQIVVTEICNSNRNVLKENNQSPTDTGVLGPILMMTQEDIDISALSSLSINN